MVDFIIKDGVIYGQKLDDGVGVYWYPNATPELIQNYWQTLRGK